MIAHSWKRNDFGLLPRVKMRSPNPQRELNGVRRQEVIGFQNVTSDHFLHLQQANTNNLSFVNRYEDFIIHCPLLSLFRTSPNYSTCNKGHGHASYGRGRQLPCLVGIHLYLLRVVISRDRIIGLDVITWCHHPMTNLVMPSAFQTDWRNYKRLPVQYRTHYLEWPRGKYLAGVRDNRINVKLQKIIILIIKIN